MTDRTRWLGFAVAALGALGTCLALPMLDPACTGGSMSVRGCGATSMAAPRAAIPVALGFAVAMATVLLASIMREAVAHHRVAQALRRTSRPSTVGGQPVGVVPAS